MTEAAGCRWQLERVTYTAGLARVNNLLVGERYFKIALEFVGADPVLLIPSEQGSAVLLHNADELKRAKWDVLDDSGTIILTTPSGRINNGGKIDIL